MGQKGLTYGTIGTIRVREFREIREFRVVGTKFSKFSKFPKLLNFMQTFRLVIFNHLTIACKIFYHKTLDKGAFLYYICSRSSNIRLQHTTNKP